MVGKQKLQNQKKLSMKRSFVMLLKLSVNSNEPGSEHTKGGI